MIFSSKLYKYNLYCFYHPFIMFQQMISLITILIQFLFKFYLSVLNFLIQSFSFVFSNKNIIIFEGKMSSDDIMEDNLIKNPQNGWRGRLYILPRTIDSMIHILIIASSEDDSHLHSLFTLWKYKEFVAQFDDYFFTMITIKVLIR